METVCNVCFYKGQSSKKEKTRYILTGTLAKQWRQFAMFAYTKGNLQEKRKLDTSKQVLWKSSGDSLQCLLIQRAIFKKRED